MASFKDSFQSIVDSVSGGSDGSHQTVNKEHDGSQSVSFIEREWQNERSMSTVSAGDSHKNHKNVFTGKRSRSFEYKSNDAYQSDGASISGSVYIKSGSFPENYHRTDPSKVPDSICIGADYPGSYGNAFGEAFNETMQDSLLEWLDENAVMDPVGKDPSKGGFTYGGNHYEYSINGKGEINIFSPDSDSDFRPELEKALFEDPGIFNEAEEAGFKSFGKAVAKANEQVRKFEIDIPVTTLPPSPSLDF